MQRFLSSNETGVAIHLAPVSCWTIYFPELRGHSKAQSLTWFSVDHKNKANQPKGFCKKLDGDSLPSHSHCANYKNRSSMLNYQDIFRQNWPKLQIRLRFEHEVGLNYKVVQIEDIIHSRGFRFPSGPSRCFGNRKYKEKGSNNTIIIEQVFMPCCSFQNCKLELTQVE